MTYAIAKQTQDTLERACRECELVLKTYPKNSMGLTLDSAKTPQWKADRKAFDDAFQALRRFNAVFVKRYKNELAAERATKRGRI